MVEIVIGFLAAIYWFYRIGFHNGVLKERKEQQAQRKKSEKPLTKDG